MTLNSLAVVANNKLEYIYSAVNGSPAPTRQTNQDWRDVVGNSVANAAARPNVRLFVQNTREAPKDASQLWVGTRKSQGKNQHDFAKSTHGWSVGRSVCVMKYRASVA